MNFLQLCQRTAQESGTIPGDTSPSTVTGQSGRLLKVVNWTSTAWTNIQNLHDDWLWMRTEFSGNTSAGSARYTSGSWAIARHARWITDPHSVTIYNAAIGVADEGEIAEIPWEAWRSRYGRGAQILNRPKEYAISPQGEMCFGPIPDATYTVRGEYQKSAQVLAANEDVPELPDSNLHTVIVWKALVLLAQFDEGQWPVGVGTVRCQDDLRSMQKYRPTITIGYGSGATIA